jgi:hypothetical protein
MRHCLIYHGGFERNFSKLKPGNWSFEGTDGQKHPVTPPPADVDGVRVGYMEKTGKKFAAVRVQKGSRDVVLKHEVLLDPTRHLGPGNRFSADPIIVGDVAMADLLADLMAKNPEQKAELTAIRGSFALTGQGGAPAR